LARWLRMLAAGAVGGRESLLNIYFDYLYLICTTVDANSHPFKVS